MAEPRSARLLVVEDERIVALDLQHSLQDLGFAVVGCAASPDEAVQQALLHRPDLILMDCEMPELDGGIDAAAEIHQHLDTPVVFLTAYAEPAMLQRAGRIAPYGYLIKPVELRELNATVHMALARHQATVRQQQDERRVRHLAFHDMLTGLGNRHHLEESLTRATASPAPLALLFLDLDGFKTINDTLGHATGDLLLAVVADRIRHCLRSGDEAIRLGGDEFVVLAQRSPDDDITRLTDRLLEAIRQPVHLQGVHEIRISSSLGVALYPEDGSTPVALLRAADVAMYAAKGSGRNRWARYSPRMSL